MASVNKVIIIGNCGRDPEVRYMPDGKAVANISIATTSKRKDQNGDTIEDTQWHRVTFYERLAEICSEYVKKGKPVYVEGRLKYGKYTDKDGVEKNTCDIVATELQLLGGRDGAEKPEPAPRQAAPRPAPTRQAPQAPRGSQGSGFSDMDDDIPFRDPMAYRGHHWIY